MRSPKPLCGLLLPLCLMACGPLNQPPGAAQITITPENPTPDDDLRCEITAESVDQNGDTITYGYEWSLDAAALGVVNTEDPAQVPAAQTLEGELWECTVTPSDSVTTGPTSTTSVTIGPPTIG